MISARVSEQNSKTSMMLPIIAMAALAITAGTMFLDRGAAPTHGLERPERKLGDYRPGSLHAALNTSWTPAKDKNGHGVTVEVPLSDPRVAKFADFQVQVPKYLPKGVKMGNVILNWNPLTKQRTVQIPLKGKHQGLITQYRLQKKDWDYPNGMILKSVSEKTGNMFRLLHTSENGVAIAVGMSIEVPDEEIVKSCETLKPLK